MAKLLRQNVGGVDYTMAGCALTGVCASSASDFIKVVALSDGDHLSDGMSVVVTFANGNTAGNAPVPQTIYSSDQTNYYSDSGMTVPFTLAPAGCYDLEYSGSGNAYSYMSYPVIQVGEVSAPLCDSRGKKTSGAVWDAGDSIVMLYTMEKFMLLSVKAFNTVTGGLMQPATSNAVANAKYTKIFDTKILSVSGWYKIATFQRRNFGASISIDLFTGYYYHSNCSHKIQINFGWNKAEVFDFAQDEQTVFDKIRICYNSNNVDDVAIYVHYSKNVENSVGLNINAGVVALTPVNFETDSLTWANTIEYNLGSSGLYTNGRAELDNKMNYFPASDLSDCNDAPDGFYCGNNVANTPNSHTGYVFVLTLSFNKDNSYKVQFCVIINNDDIYVRNKVAGTWTAWTKKTV